MAKKKTKEEPTEFEDVCENMHIGLAKELLSRIKNGTATPSDLNVARQFLKDNHIEGNLRKHKPLLGLAETLPFAAEA